MHTNQKVAAIFQWYYSGGGAPALTGIAINQDDPDVLVLSFSGAVTLSELGTLAMSGGAVTCDSVVSGNGTNTIYIQLSREIVPEEAGTYTNSEIDASGVSVTNNVHIWLSVDFTGTTVDTTKGTISNPSADDLELEQNNALIWTRVTDEQITGVNEQDRWESVLSFGANIVAACLMTKITGYTNSVPRFMVWADSDNFISIHSTATNPGNFNVVIRQGGSNKYTFVSEIPHSRRVRIKYNSSFEIQTEYWDGDEWVAFDIANPVQTFNIGSSVKIYIVSNSIALDGVNDQYSFDEVRVTNADYNTEYPENFFFDVNMVARTAAADLSKASATAGFYQWGSCVTKIGSQFLYIGNMWADTDGFVGWVHYNKIYFATSSNRLGPFTDLTEISVLRSQSWAEDVVTNPFLLEYGGKYYLFYVGSHYDEVSYPAVDSEARANQKIGVAVAESAADALAGNFVPYSGNPILEPSASDWDQTIVNNPSVWVDKNGLLRMAYKSDYFGDKGTLRMGIATASNPLGPWGGRTNEPNFPLDGQAEDPNVWREGNKWYMIAKAFDSSVVTFGHGILFESWDGINWEMSKFPEAWRLQMKIDDGSVNTYLAVERPFVLVENGRATALFTAVRTDNPTSFNLGRNLIA